MKALPSFIALAAVCLSGCAEDYGNTPNMDGQKRLNEQYQRGEISREQYEEGLSRFPESPRGGATGVSQPRQEHYSF